MMALFWQLLKYAKPYRLLISGSIICNILTALFTVISAPAIIPFLQILFDIEQPVIEVQTFSWTFSGIKNYIVFLISNLIQTEGKKTALIYICIGIILLFFFKNFFRYLSFFFMAPVRNGMVSDIRQQLFDKIISMDMAWLTEKRKGDLIARATTDVQEIEWSVFNILPTFFRDPLVIIGSFFFLLYVSPSLTLFVFILMLFTAIIIGGIGKSLKRKSNKVQEALSNIIVKLEESLTGLKIIKSYNATNFQSKQFKKENNQYKDLLTRLLWRRDLSSPLSEFLGITMVAILLWYGSGLVFSGELEAATFMAFLLAFFNISQPTKSFSSAFYHIQKGMAAVDRIEAILEEKNTIGSPSNAQIIKKFSNAITLKNVSFTYPFSNQKVLSNITIDIPKGKVIAIVGASGSGKTTLIDLLLRFYETEHGEIFIDNINIKNMSLDNLRGLFSVVSQDPILFNDTIFNNIVFGLESVDLTKVEQVAKIAYAHDFIMATSNGYHTKIGDQGSKLSGGQKQRITIARAILRNAPILILDEATSALDSESETLVQKALQQLMKNRTTIIITHRLSTVQYADEIIVLEDGDIIERGTHQHLLRNKGTYQKFVHLGTINND